MKKRMIDANHLKARFEAEYGGYSWYDLVRIMTLIDTEPTQQDNMAEKVVTITAITGTMIALAVLLVVSLM